MDNIRCICNFLHPSSRAELLRWAGNDAVFTPGRQGTGYDLAAVPENKFSWVRELSFRALGIDASAGYDCYVMRYKRGSRIPKHKDTAFFGSRHLRVNALIQKASEGGRLLIEDVPFSLYERDAYVFRPDLLNHEVTEITEGERYMWTMGTMLSEETP